MASEIDGLHRICAYYTPCYYMNGPRRQHGKTTGSLLWDVSGAPILSGSISGR